MKKLLILALLTGIACAQNTNPQSNFSTQLISDSPSLYLNYNDLTTSFRDSVSGLNFSPLVAPQIPNGQPYAGFFDGSTVSAAATSSGLSSNATFSYSGWVNVTTFYQNLIVFGDSSNSDGVALWLNGDFEVYLGYTWLTTGISVTGGWHHIAITRDGTTMKLYVDGVQETLTSPTSSVNSPTGHVIFGKIGGGFSGKLSDWQTYSTCLTSAQVTTLYTSGGTISGAGLTNRWLLNEGIGSTFVESVAANSAAITGTMPYYAANTPTGVVTPRQPGFDNTQANNTSASVAYNAGVVGPNDSLGNLEWSSPFSILIHIDRLAWNRTGTLILASKGDINAAPYSYWDITLQMQGLFSVLCFTENSHNSTGAPNAVSGFSICTSSSVDVMPNGYNYDIIATNDSTGYASSLGLYLNGLQVTPAGSINGGTSLVAPGFGFGLVGITASGGTGYANPTAFTATGGGAHCVVTGNLPTSGGAFTGTINWTQSSGCLTTPTIVLTAPTGTGGTITPTVYTSTIGSSTTFPLMVPGYVSVGMYYGIDGTDSTQTSTYVDEFAEFPTALTINQVTGIYYQTKFFQNLVFGLPAQPAQFIFDDDWGTDPDNVAAFALAFAAQKQGFLHLAGIVNEDQSPQCEAMSRQMLDQAGLAHIPQSVPATFWANSGTGYCTVANINTYNAGTPQSNSAWGLASPMYRTIMAANPTTPVNVILGGPFTGYAEFLASGADGISSLTGLQLQARNAANGGAIYAQGLYCSSTTLPNTLPCSGTIGYLGDNSLIDATSGAYVVSNNGSMPIYWYVGGPQSSGPDQIYTRTAKDPYYLALATAGTYTRTAFDSVPLTALLTQSFARGISIGYSGGTGYANSTSFNFSGGGTYCQGNGVMTASGGVPNGITYQWGLSATAFPYYGIGHGCTSNPTITLVSPTGTGVTLTPYPIAVCATYTINAGASTGSTSSSTCSNHYFLQEAITTIYGEAPILTWFLNSLIDQPPNPIPKQQ